MARMVVLGKKSFYGGAMLLLLIFLGTVLYVWTENTKQASVLSSEDVHIQMAVVEYKAELDQGKEMEMYRWDPGYISVRKGDRVHLHMHGVNHSSHPFVLKGYDVKGEVKPGEVTDVQFVADEAGLFQLICLTHQDQKHEGPMIGYVRVLP